MGWGRRRGETEKVRESNAIDSKKRETHIELLHAHRVQHVSQKLMRVLLPEIKILIVLAAYRCEEDPGGADSSQ